MVIGKLVDSTDVQQTVADTIHDDSKPQKVIAKEADFSHKHINRKLSGRKMCEMKKKLTAAFLSGDCSKVHDGDYQHVYKSHRTVIYPRTWARADAFLELNTY